ncbi:MAG: NAD(P)H-dependent oxidoreductase subunit E [Bacillota bacterium]|nr:NAD(P)H-dependent oxidoreductase subunit E [Bacillota bacterium]
MSHLELDMSILEPGLLAELDAYIESLPDPQGSIIAVLHKAQELNGYLPRELQLYVARRTGLPTAKINGIVTFYSFFSEVPSGVYTISVCTGTACFVKGAQEVLDRFREELKLEEDEPMTEDGLFSINDVRCIGACGLAPVVRVNERIFGHVKPDQVSEIIAQHRKEAADAS